jgi:hypothetical protein
MRRIAEFRATLHSSRENGQARRRNSLPRRLWLVAGTVMALGVLASPRPALRFGAAPNFGSPVVGSRSPERFVSLHNSGLAPLTISDIRISGPEREDFLPGTTDCTGAAVPPGKDCLFGVVFSPRGEGHRVAEIEVVSDDLLVPPHFALTATAAGRADFRIAPMAISFGDRKVGAASDEKVTEISNLGTTPVRIQEAQITNAANSEFLLASNSCTETLPKGGTCAIGVSFHPQMAGERTGQLRLLDDSGDPPHEVALTGRGTAGDLALEPEEVSFPATRIGQRSGPQSVQIRNSGTDDVHLGAVTLAGANAGEFTVLDKNVCESVTLRVGAACVLQAQFQPNTPGSRTASISFADDAPDGPHSVQLAGTGTEVDRPSAQIYAKTYSFGRQLVGTASKALQAWVVSRGKAPLTIGTVDFQGGKPRDFELKTNCSRRTLKLNDECEIDVYFSPVTAGETQAQISVPHDAPDAPTLFSVDGTGFAEERGWCCVEGRLFAMDGNACRNRRGQFFTDPNTAQSKCSRSSVAPNTAQAEAPTGLQPGTPSPPGGNPITCESVTLQWDSVPAPGGYLVSLARLERGIDTRPLVILSQNVFTNSYRVPSALETGTYEWSVTSLGDKGQRNVPARPNYFLCGARINVAKNPKIATLSILKAKPTSVVSPRIQ